MKKAITLTLFSILILSCAWAIGGCAGQNSSQATVHFEMNIDLETNVIRDQVVTKGKKAKKPNAFILHDNTENLEVYGWYTSPDYEREWNFKKDVVNEDITLYAKWLKKCTVNYYLGDSLTETYSMFSGSTAQELTELAFGYEYLGSYCDPEYTVAFDYTQPITDDTDIYMKRSDTIYLSEEPKEGQKETEKLSYYLEALLGSVDAATEANGDEEGYVEAKTLKNGEECVYVNFGYTPTYGDGYVELAYNLDITSSQIIRLCFKNLGPCTNVCAFFTAMNDLENETYSLTGAEYSQKYCYPNYEGAGEGPLQLNSDQINMSEDDEWQYIDFDLSSICTNGYSVWGTSKYLGKLRIQANYKSDPNNPEDCRNVFLIKSIEGVSKEIEVRDSEAVSAKLKNASQAELDEKVATQAERSNGLVFPLNADALAGDKTVLADTYNTVDGLMIHTDNEIAFRDREDNVASVTLLLPADKSISLDELTTLNIGLQNFGYARELTVLLYNDIGSRVMDTVAIDNLMPTQKIFTYNFYKKKGMTGNLTKIEFRYTAVGVDNALLVSEIFFSEYKPFDIVGISFNDKQAYGFSSGNGVTVSFDDSREGTAFDVAVSGASIETVCERRTTTDGYSGATLNYVLPADSAVTCVTVGYYIDGEYVEYRHVLDSENRGKTMKSSVVFDPERRGKVEKLSLRFEGTGKVVLKSVSFDIGENTIDFSCSFDNLYRLRYEWLQGCSYSYDSIRSASVLTGTGSASLFSQSFYIGYSSRHYADNVPYSFGNVKVDEEKKTKIKIIYQNRTAESTLNFIGGFDRSESGVADTSGIEFLELYNLSIDCNMQEYEWSCLEIEIPERYVNFFFAKFTIQFGGNELSVRTVAIEKE